MYPLNPTSIRYIKLGEKGCWQRDCVTNGVLQVRYLAVGHALALSGDRQAIRQAFIDSGQRPRTATKFTNELLDFYQLPADCLWFTLANDRLWWCFADTEVIWIGGDGEDRGARERRAIGGWRDTSIAGVPLVTTTVSTALLKVARTQCTIADGEPYRKILLRLINGESDPLQCRTRAIAEELCAITERAIRQLHQEDLETLADLILARSGWHRVSPLGGNLPRFDLAVEQPATGERAFVQVKSAANQSVLDDVVADYDASGAYQRMIFVCHSSKSQLQAGERQDVEIWAGADLAERAVRAGLFEWVAKRIA